MRLDIYLAEKGIYKSRTRAAEAVRSGCVFLREKPLLKPSYDLTDSDISALVCLPDPLEYVSRGALKLEYALKTFSISVAGLYCADIGASTGGFTHVLLRSGASHVTALDVGHGQLSPEIASDPRVLNAEGTDVRRFEPERKFDFLSMDVSFISVRLLAEKISGLLHDGADAVILFKPQFEVGRSSVGKRGVVKDQRRAMEAMRDTVAVFESEGLFLQASCDSPVTGGDGNREYLLHLKKREKTGKHAEKQGEIQDGKQDGKRAGKPE